MRYLKTDQTREYQFVSRLRILNTCLPCLKYSLLILFCSFHISAWSTPWSKHVIDSSSIGADGVRILDINGDGLGDISTGWEEGGLIRVYLNPGPKAIHAPWPKVTVGRVASPEDAVFCDLDKDGQFDVISSCEGRTKSGFIHWAPSKTSSLLNPEAWKTETVPCLQGRQSWMFAAPANLDDHLGPEVILGSKGVNGSIGILSNSLDPRTVSAWKYREIRKAGWIMSIRILDVDADGDADILASDRRPPNSGCFWLENPGKLIQGAHPDWREYHIGSAGREVMFIDFSRETDKSLIVAAAVKPNRIQVFHQSLKTRAFSESFQFSLPSNFGTAKAVRMGDMNLDGIQDFTFTCENASEGKSGVGWFKGSAKSGIPPNDCQDISGPIGTKFDRIELMDLDEDGDLDLLTCEERERLGVIWYENPLR